MMTYESSLPPRCVPKHLSPLFWARAEFRPWAALARRRRRTSRNAQFRGTFLALFALPIAPSLKSELASHWERLFGYSTETLFPDLDGFARADHWTADLRDLAPGRHARVKSSLSRPMSRYQTTRTATG